MAWKYFTPEVYDGTDICNGNYFVEESLAAASNGDSYILPSKADRVTVGLVIGTGVAKVQYTLSSVAAVKADTADWRDWPEGDVTDQDADYEMANVTAVRQVNTSGTTKLQANALGPGQ